MHGDDVVLFAVWHSSELADPDRFDAYLSAPLEYSLGLKSLEQGAAEVRVAKLTYYARSQWDARTIALWAGGAAIVGLLVWRWRRRRE